MDDGLLTIASLFSYVSVGVNRLSKSHHSPQDPAMNVAHSGMIVMGDFRRMLNPESLEIGKYPLGEVPVAVGVAQPNEGNKEPSPRATVAPEEPPKSPSRRILSGIVIVLLLSALGVGMFRSIPAKIGTERNNPRIELINPEGGACSRKGIITISPGYACRDCEAQDALEIILYKDLGVARGLPGDCTKESIRQDAIVAVQDSSHAALMADNTLSLSVPFEVLSGSETSLAILHRRGAGRCAPIQIRSNSLSCPQ